MSKFDNLSVLCLMKERPIVPVFYNNDPHTAAKVALSCAEGGIRLFEFTNRGDRAAEVFADLEATLRKERPDMALGAGSIVDAPTAAIYISLGADFIVGPMFNAEVARLCNRRGIPYIPGCGSVSEISSAQEAGCSVVKVFPGNVLGPGFVKAVLAPMPWTKIMVTGGVTPEADSIKSWMDAGAFCLGMGSKLFPKEAIQSGRFDEITARCASAIEVATSNR